VLTEDRARTKTTPRAAGGAQPPRYIDERSQRRAWLQARLAAGVRYRPPKECRDTSVTLALMAGANPVWVAMQHGHSVQVMMRDYAKWIPSADRGANLAAVNATLGAATEGPQGRE